jgi:hypothetical protein
MRAGNWEHAYIYCLSDPRDGAIRYVGVSVDPKARYRVHLYDLRHATHKVHWIKSLLTQGIRPIMTVIQRLPYACWTDAERYWIQHFRDLGCDLTNGTAGGEGWLGRRHSTLTRERIATKKTGQKQSEVTKVKRARSNGGRPIVDQFGTVYETIRGCAQQLGLQPANIRAVLNGRARSAGGGKGNGKYGEGYRFSYFTAGPR